MKRNLLICTIIFLVIQLVTAQTVLLVEDFETNGEGSRYNSNAFNIGNSDYFVRYQDGDAPAMTADPTGESGTFYWVGEDCDAASGGTGILTLNAANISGFNVEVRALLAIGRDGGDRFESGDEHLFQYNIDGAGWNTCGAFYGGFGAPNSSPTQDTNLDGTPDGPGVLSNAFTEYVFAIPTTGTNMQIRFIMGQDQGTEELAVDNIRIISTSPLPIELLGFLLQETAKGEVEINWQTASEQNNEFFIVERSTNGVSWEDVFKISSLGNTNNILNYKAIDRDPSFGRSYYRLKQIDFDGTFSYASIKSIHLQPNKNNLSIFPNPASTALSIYGEKGQLKDLQIINSIGLNITKLINIHFLSETKIKVDVSKLPTGVYYFQTTTTSSKVQIIHVP